MVAYQTNGTSRNRHAMALARIEILEGRTADEQQRIVAAVRDALSEALKAPREDPLVRLTSYPRELFTLPYPERHSKRFALIEVTMFAGRSTETKRRLYEAIVRNLDGLVPAGDVSIVVHEPPMENWAVGGVPASEKDVGFDVEI